MSQSLDVALRMRLERAGFEEGQRDVNELRRAADRLGTTRGGEQLGRDLKQVGKAAETAESDVKSIGQAAERLGRNQGAENMGRNFASAAQKIHSTELAINDVRTAIREVDREDLDRLRRKVGSTTKQVDELGKSLHSAGRSKQSLQDTGGAASFLATSATRAMGALAAFASVDQIIAGLSRVEEGFRNVDKAAAKTATTAETYGPGSRQALIDENKRLGGQYGASQQGVSDARQVFVEGGTLTPDQLRASMPSTLRTAFGSQSSPETIARAGRAAMENMGITAEQLPAFYDIMAKGGKLGAFETEAQARNFPQLGAQMKGLGGVTGLKGSADLTAMLQVARRNTGTEDEAANNLTNFLASITSPETISNFKEKRSNLPRILEQARTSGQNPALAVVDEPRRLTGGDPVKLGQLFGDQQAMNAVRALIQNRGDLEAMRGQILNESGGTIERDFQYMQSTPSGKADMLSAQREASGLAIGQALNPGANVIDRAITRAMQGGAYVAEGYNKGGIAEGISRHALPSVLWKYLGVIGGMGGRITGKDAPPPNVPDEEEIAARQAEAERLAEEIARDRAAIAGSGRSQNWMAESRVAVKQHRYDELVGGLRSDLGAAEAGKASGESTAELETRLQALTQAIRDLEKKLGSTGAGGINPISFGGGNGQPRLWNASLGGGRGGSAGGFRSAYSGGAPVMDGMANRPIGAGGAAMGVGAPRGRVDVTSNPGGAAGEVYDVLSADFNDAQSMALLGYVQQESSLDPTSWNAKEGAGGLLQWRGNRLENLKRFAADRGMNWQDRKVQAAFVSHEMQTDPYERKRSARFRSATTIPEASAALKDYVRFGDDSAGTRLQNANRFAKEFGARESAGAALPGNVSYANGGATRNRAVTPELADAIGRGVAAVYGEGYRAEIYSGGQAAKGSGGKRTGSTRHDDHGHGGRAADLYVYGPDGRKVTGEDLAKLGQHWAATGEGGVGMEMRGGGIHLDEHKDRARSWNYTAQGGSYSPAQADRMRRGLAGQPPEYANPNALNPSAAGAKGGATLNLTQNIRGGFDARLAAERSRREQHRAIRLAESGAMHDTMVQPA